MLISVSSQQFVFVFYTVNLVGLGLGLGLGLGKTLKKLVYNHRLAKNGITKNKWLQGF